MPSAPGLYACIKIWKNLYKIRLQRDLFETCNKWLKWQDVSVYTKISSPGGCLPLPRGYIHALNHEFFFIKSDFKEIFFIPPAKHSFSGVYCFQHVRHSVIPKFCQHLRWLRYNFDSFCPILFKFTPQLIYQTLHVW